jgi:tetratricopeptide (TPR) repeat protein
LDLSNLACAQSAMQHFDDAIQSARAALRLEPANPNAHFILGSLLARDRRSLPEGISHLEIAAESNPAARPNLERAQAAMAHTTQAP